MFITLLWNLCCISGAQVLDLRSTVQESCMTSKSFIDTFFFSFSSRGLKKLEKLQCVLSVCRIQSFCRTQISSFDKRGLVSRWTVEYTCGELRWIYIRKMNSVKWFTYILTLWKTLDAIFSSDDFAVLAFLCSRKRGSCQAAIQIKLGMLVFEFMFFKVSSCKGLSRCLFKWLQPEVKISLKVAGVLP